MKKKTLKMALCSIMSAVMLASVIDPVRAAEEPSWKTDMKDHWNFDSLSMKMGQSLVLFVISILRQVNHLQETHVVT